MLLQSLSGDLYGRSTSKSTKTLSCISKDASTNYKYINLVGGHHTNAGCTRSHRLWGWKVSSLCICFTIYYESAISCSELLNDLVHNCRPTCCTSYCSWCNNDQPCTAACEMQIDISEDSTRCENPLSWAAFCDKHSESEDVWLFLLPTFFPLIFGEYCTK